MINETTTCNATAASQILQSPYTYSLAYKLSKIRFAKLHII